ncbi:MAG: 50S ribosomal protein L29 [Candidatus Doudnabacteria bacterium]|nr:50S ribosomal protein L29 [Candidatus Doudnabacteria bacterium]
MKFQELLNKSEDQLRKELAVLRAEVEKLTVKVRLAQTKNTNELPAKRREVARILTALRQK